MGPIQLESTQNSYDGEQQLGASEARVWSHDPDFTCGKE